MIAAAPLDDLAGSKAPVHILHPNLENCKSIVTFIAMPFSTPKKVDIRYDADEVQNMLNLLKAAPFPDRAPIDADPWKLGTEYEYLKELKTIFEKEWSWAVLEKKLARYDNFLVHYEDGEDSLDLHYVYVRSTRSDAIPLILLHGWPG